MVLLAAVLVRLPVWLKPRIRHDQAVASGFIKAQEGGIAFDRMEAENHVRAHTWRRH